MSFFQNHSNWPLVPLKDIATLKRGYDLPVKSRAEGDVPIYAANGQNGTHNVAKIKAPGVVTGRSGTIGKVHYTERDYWPLNTALYVTDFHGNEPKWVFYMLQAFKLERFVEGAGVPTLNRNLVHDELIPLPPLKEQKRIAAILDKADAICRKRKYSIDLAEQFLRSVFLDMFGDPVTNPKGWKVQPVGKVVDCIVPGRDKPKSFTGDIPWITTNDLFHLGTTFSSKSGMGLSVSEINEVRAKVIPKDSVLMTCVGDLGLVSISGCDFVMNQQLHAFLPNEQVNKYFLMYALSFQKGHMKRVASSTTVPYMNKTICNNVPLITPMLKEQSRFGLIYEATMEAIVKSNDSLSELNALFNSLRQRAFKGKL
ncbi:Type I restriction-modification system, specificity subunit S [Vibrio chagasii]|nr:Type I restriction-modification system, specificity subunit S [Vibrio chagasii]